jgi:signal transduction histidine kinase/ActR/RegA family two-component response regulator
MNMFGVPRGRLSRQITLALAALFLLLVLFVLGQTWVSNAVENDLRRGERAHAVQVGLEEGIANAQEMLRVTVPMFLSPQGPFFLAAQDASRSGDYEAGSLLPAFNDWNNLLNLRLSRITVCNSDLKAAAWVGAAGVNKAVPAGAPCGGAFLAAAAQSYARDPVHARPLEGVVRAGGALYVRQYVFVQAMNPDTFTNQIVMVLMVDQSLAPILDRVKHSLGLSSAVARSDSARSGHTLQNGQLVVNIPLRGVSGEVAGHAELRLDIATLQFLQLRSLLLQAAGASIVLALAWLVVVALLQQRVFAPLARLATSAAMLDDEDILDQAPFCNRQDEIGELADGVRAGIAARRAELAAREAADTANHAKSEFLAVMSHEIRTPLNGVLGMAEAMARDDLSQIQRERLEVISRSGASLLAILNDILDLSKVEAGKLVLEQSEFDMEELALGAHSAFTALANAKGLSFDLVVSPAARGVYCGDSVRVRQVLYNLLSNAVKFTSVGEVNVEIDRKDGFVHLTVRDTGMGVAPDQIGRLFQKFVQADSSTTRRFGGTGLGLAICTHLCEAMGGDITVESTLGQGTTFTVRLALQRLDDRAIEPRGARTLPAPASGTAHYELKVLAAEDNPTNQLVLKTILAQAGIWPTIVEDGAAAVEEWAREEWDVILMDVQMPVMDGPTAARAIRAREAETGRSPTPIIALTANVMTHQVEAYRAAGMTGFLAKPINISDLFSALSEVSKRTGPAQTPPASATDQGPGKTSAA